MYRTWDNIEKYKSRTRYFGEKQTVTDEEIIQLVINGDVEKYGEIIARYEKRLRGFVKRLIGNNLEVDDIVEDSLILAYQNLNGFDQKQKFSSWILRIVHNKTVDYIKRKKTKINKRRN